MKIITVEFKIATKYLKSEHSEERIFEFDSEESDNDINETIDQAYQIWLERHNQGGWDITNVETSKEE